MVVKSQGSVPPKCLKNSGFRNCGSVIGLEVAKIEFWKDEQFLLLNRAGLFGWVQPSAFFGGRSNLPLIQYARGRAKPDWFFVPNFVSSLKKTPQSKRWETNPKPESEETNPRRLGLLTWISKGFSIGSKKVVKIWGCFFHPVRVKNAGVQFRDFPVILELVTCGRDCILG